MPLIASSLRLLTTSIGAGNFGTVFEAHDDILGKVAAKRIRRQPGESDGDWQRRRQNLTDEGRLQALAEHENVVPVYQVVEDDSCDDVYLIMKFCAGGSLDNFYKRGPLSIGAARRYLTDVARGLLALHSRKMLHRDIKPSNILLDSNGRALIADFGLVTDRLMHGYASQRGYWDHLAKEIYDGDPASVRSDVWALGMTAYRLLHGHDWYQSYPRPRDCIERGGYAKRLCWLPHIPDSWRRFIRKCMHDDKDLRISSMSEIQEELAKLTVVPDWICRLDLPNRIYSWESTKSSRGKTRRVVVACRPENSGFCWNATSLPLASSGVQRRLDGGSAKTWSELMSALSAYFKSCI